MRRALLVALATAGLTLVPATAASAHPLGNFTVNTADRGRGSHNSMTI